MKIMLKLPTGSFQYVTKINDEKTDLFVSIYPTNALDESYLKVCLEIYPFYEFRLVEK